LIQPDQLYLANFPFGDAAGMKLRPVLTLTGPLGAVPEVLVAYISSVVPAQLLSSDIMHDPSLPDHSSTKLKSESVLRLHKLATIHQTSIVRQLGTLPPMVAAQVDQVLRDLLKI
jgi:mRNA interferase MazF